MIVIEAADEAAARAVFENDPYVKADLFEMVSVSAFRTVIERGALVE
jgi:uncharacterized protein YciI